jgi:hypothetical protein
MKIRDEVFKKEYEGELLYINIDEIPAEFLQQGRGYLLAVERDPGYYSDNNSWDPYTELIIYQEREETEAEKQKRLQEWEEHKEEHRKERYETYLNLKAEFENGNSNKETII